MTVLLMALAGGVGAVLRHLIDSTVRRGLLLVNVTGSLALGLLTGAAANETALLVVGTGLLGGYTSFSSAILDAARSGATVRTAATSLVLCVAAASAGVAISSTWLR